MLKLFCLRNFPLESPNSQVEGYLFKAFGFELIEKVTEKEKGWHCLLSLNWTFTFPMFRRARGTHQWVWLLCTNWCTNSTKIHLSYQESYPVVYLGLLCLTRHLLCTSVDIHSAHFHSSFGCIFTRPSLLSLSQAVLIDAPTVLKLHLVYKVPPIRFSLSLSPFNKPLFTQPVLFTWLLSASSTNCCPSPDFSNIFSQSTTPKFWLSSLSGVFTHMIIQQLHLS